MLDQPLQQRLRAVQAHELALRLLPRQAPVDHLVLKRGVTPTSWGAEITVRLSEVSPAETKLEFKTHETWAIIDWGRGRRQVGRLLDASPD